MDRDFVILDSVFYLGLIVLAYPLLWLLISGFNRQPLVYKWLAIALAFGFAIDVVARLLWYVRNFVHINPNSIGHLYQLFGTAFISVFFYHAIQWPTLKRTFIFINILYFIFSLVNLLFLQKSSLHSYSQTLQSIIILFLCIIFYFKLLKELPTQQIQKLPLFWIVSGFFFSYAGKLVIYAITHYMIAIGDDFILISIFHVSLTLIAYLIMAVGVWLNDKQTSPGEVHKSIG